MQSSPTMSPTPDLSILIISYNTRELTLEAIESAIAQTKSTSYEILVVDNASADGSADAIEQHYPADRFPQVRLLRAVENLGFAKANNLAARAARGQYLLLLNSDTRTLDGATDRLVEFLAARPDVGIAGGRTFFDDGSLNRNSCHGAPTLWMLLCQATGLSSVFRKSGWLNPEGLGDWPRDSERDVPAVTGCLLLIRADLWRALDGFDEQFFMYGEDTDLCVRTWRKGLRCTICPDARIVHHGGRSDRVRAEKMLKLFRAKAQLMLKHWPARRVALGVGCLKAWAFTRRGALRLLSLRASSESRRQSFAAWDEIWKRRHEFCVRAV